MPITSARPAALYDRVRNVVSTIGWSIFAGDVEAILELKQGRNAVILAHTIRHRRSSTVSRHRREQTRAWPQGDGN